MKLRLLLFATLLAMAFGARAQELTHRLGEFLVSVTSDEEFIGHFDGFNQQFAEEKRFRIEGKAAATMNIWHLSVDYTVAHEYRMLEELREQEWVRLAQFNHLIRNRSVVPNDPEYPNLWHFFNTGAGGGLLDADIDADEAWMITTGGTTVDGKEIVVAVIDDGIELTHPDLIDNIWINPDEVPDNGLDDDNNGYTDDLNGWNTFFNDGTVNMSTGSINHGVYVSGMIGATGNNETGITGVNWNVKLMPVVGGDGSELNALQSYEYVLQQRRRYNQTDGAEGAFVVSANSSWGVDLEPEDAPLWCAYYDSMGAEGIINVGATKNINVDIDQVGDLPTACPSDYLIAVTASDRNDLRNFSAYGRSTIDLAAPGQNVITTDVNGSYRTETGTSFASPLVAGAIGLLYAIPCNSLQSIAQADPAAAALLAKDYIMRGVDRLPQFEGELVSEGRLNVNNALQIAMTECLSCPYPTSVEQTGAGLNSFTMSWVVNDTIGVNLRFREAGTTEWDTLSDVSAPLSIPAEQCTQYELQFQAVCPGDTSEFGESIFVVSGGCCDPPEDIEFVISATDEINVLWGDVLAAETYKLRYRFPGDLEWTVLNGLPQNNATLGPVIECMLYEVQILSNCPGGQSGYSESAFYISPVCYDCDTLSYCEVPDTINADFEWIDSIYLNGSISASANDDGYGDFTGEPFAFLNLEMSHDFRIVQDYAFNTFDEYFRIWIDLNIDGDFDDDGELVFDAGAGQDTPIEGEIFIPSDAHTGNTRMRVAMKFVSQTDTLPPGACPDYEDGEVEDYCIVINGCGMAKNLEVTGGGMEEAELSWDEVAAALAYNIRYRPEGSPDWMEESVLENSILLDGLDCGLLYEVQVRSICPLDTSSYTETVLIEPCPNPTSDPEFSAPATLKVYPNPFIGHVTLEWKQEAGSIAEIELYDLSGKRHVHRSFGQLPSGFQVQQVEGLEALPAGIYIVRLWSGPDVRSAKLVKTD